MSTDVQPTSTDQAAPAVVSEAASTTPQEPTAGAATEPTADALSPDLFASELQTAIASGDKTVQDMARSMNRAFTQKTQALANERKELEHLRAFSDAWKADPTRAVKLLASQVGLEFREPAPPAPAVDAVNDALTNGLRQALGPEWGDLPDRLAPALAPLTQKIAEQAIAQALKPIKDDQEKLIKDSAEREMQAQMSAFEKKHPDFKQHESRMVELSQRFLPAQGVSEQEYLEQLYFLAARDSLVSAEVQRAIAKIGKSAEGASGAPASVAASKVVTRPSGPITIAEAYAAAKRGETLA